MTLDIWTSDAKDSYLGLTIHFIDKPWDLISLKIACRCIRENHTGENLADWVKELLGEFKLTPWVYVADNASNLNDSFFSVR